MHRVCVRIDLDRLQERLSRERGKAYSSPEVYQWLYCVGFRLEGYWVCDSEEAVKKLRPDEIQELMRTVEEQSIHFIEREKPQESAE